MIKAFVTSILLITICSIGRPREIKPKLLMSDYQISLQLDKISSRVDYCIGYKQPFYRLTAKLTNNSNDTLKYVDWYCSHAVWSTDNHSLQIYESSAPCYVCQYNILTVFEVPPHQTKTMKMTLAAIKGKFPARARFRIGLTLLEANKLGSFLFNIDKFERILSNKAQSRIWSNTVMLP